MISRKTVFYKKLREVMVARLSKNHGVDDISGTFHVNEEDMIKWVNGLDDKNFWMAVFLSFLMDNDYEIIPQTTTGEAKETMQ